MKTHLFRLFAIVLLLALSQSWAEAQEFDFSSPPNANDQATVAVMRDLAVRILPVYQDNNQDRFLSNLSALQVVAGDYSSANATRQSLRDRRRNSGPNRPNRQMIYDIYANARMIEAQSRIPFSQAFALAYKNAVPRLEDQDAYVLAAWFATPLSELRDAFQRELDQLRSKNRINLAEGLELIYSYLAFESYRSFGALVGPLNAAEDRRRYINENVTIKTADGATIVVILYRPKLLKELPALLEFTIYNTQGYAKEAAAHGFVGVMGYARGINGSTGTVSPFTHDGDDARAVVNWITKQEWSNQRVGMYGSGYSGFTAWAAARRASPGLKAVATTDPIVPGVDVPMSGNIFRNSSYRWAYNMTREQGATEKVFDDEAAWRTFNQAWYSSGKSYREFVSIPGPHSTLFGRWLSHPSYDRFWQRLAPDKEQLAHVNIPVLTTTGYFSDGEVSALHYFNEHHRHNPRANHTLVIGPYDDGGFQHGASGLLRGYQPDQAALIDLRELRYEWFDHVLKGEKKPALLKDRINYQFMGTNEWRSAASFEALSTSSLKLYLEPAPNSDPRNRLMEKKSEQTAFLPQTFDLENREDVNNAPPFNLVSRTPAVNSAEIFVSEPLPQPVELAGLISGSLDFTVNKMDMDIALALYELLPNGEYVALIDPSFAFRASYAKSRSQRRLLKAGVRQQLAFDSERMTSRRLQAGSRVALVLGINKRPDQQINYGTGKDVSEETIADARIPLRIRWYNSSYIDLPVRK